ncbi:MAG: type I pullulanase [Lachnospiraceae bacterium]|nr:type I pullulanase [Lachnospiraceae bacterium]
MSMRSPLEWKRFFESEEFDKEYEYTGDNLGVVLGEKETTFRIWAPTAESVSLNLYESGDSGADDGTGIIPMQRTDKGVWMVSVENNLKNTYYTYTVTANGETHETQDVYAKACGVNGRRSMVVDLRDTDPDGWQKDEYTYDAASLPVIYEVHIKDFSYAESSGIPKEYRGKYRAFTIEGSTLYGKGEKSTCISYLKELGITHVHLLPCFDFGSVDEAGDFDTQFNWGYDPVNYNIPEGSYATNAQDGRVRIREFKEMVMALHQAGIGVIMDVVYNHTFALDSCFQRTVPYYYYRVREDGTMSNGSACGNDTASERAMFRRYMTESVCYWAKEYHIDGFRFDLMGLHDVETMNAIRKALDEMPDGKHILMYGEPWAAADTAMKKGAVPALKKNVELLDERIAIFNDDTRDTVKGDIQDAKLPGFVNGGEGLEDKICSAVLAWCDGKGGYQPHNPGQTITYVSAHDNWTLWDKLCYTLQTEPDFNCKDERVVQANKFAAGVVMTSLGTVFMQAGEEAARTKRGIGDSYNSPAALNALDWERMYRFEDLLAYYKGMLAIRKSCPGYWHRDKKVLEKIQFHHCEQGCIAFAFNAQSSHDKWKRLWVVYSTRKEPYRLSLPKADRVLLADGARVLSQPAELEEKEYVQIETMGVSVFGEPLSPF